MAAFIPPTVGRIVWYYPGPLRHVAFQPDKPLMATICGVNEDTGRINVGGFDFVGQPYSALNVTLVQEGESIDPGAEHCRWMPYQVGQAAKMPPWAPRASR